MTDGHLPDPAFERALRGALADLAPEVAPESLRVAVAAVPIRRGRHVAARVRALVAAVGLAAAVIVAVAGLGMVTRQDAPIGGPPPVGTGSLATPTPGTATFTFRVVTGNGSTASKAQVDAVGEVMAARLRAYGIGTFSSSASDDRISIELTVPSPPGSVDEIRSLLGTTGAFTVGEPSAAPAELGAPVEGRPMLGGEDITSARVGNDQTGRPTLDVTVSGKSATALADATRAHIGQYLPIALDGVAISVPVIQDEVPDGRMQIRFPSDDRVTPSRLAAILQGGPLPLHVEPVTS